MTKPKPVKPAAAPQDNTPSAPLQARDIPAYVERVRQQVQALTKQLEHDLDPASTHADLELDVESLQLSLGLSLDDLDDLARKAKIASARPTEIQRAAAAPRVGAIVHHKKLGRHGMVIESGTGHVVLACRTERWRVTSSQWGELTSVDLDADDARSIVDRVLPVSDNDPFEYVADRLWQLMNTMTDVMNKQTLAREHVGQAQKIFDEMFDLHDQLQVLSFKVEAAWKIGHYPLTMRKRAGGQ